MSARPTRLYDAYVFDMDGTIYLGDELLPGAHRLISELRRREVPVRFLSNNPTRDPDMYAAKLTKLGLTRVELRGPGTEGTFTCTFPLSFQGRLIEGIRGEFRGGRLVRLDAKSKADRDFLAAYIDSDPKGNGRRLGEVALVDSTSRIGQSGRMYFDTLLDENAAAHIAFGSGFGQTRTQKPARGLNQSPVHLDVMIGSPDFEATGVTAKGTRVPVIRDGLFQL